MLTALTGPPAPRSPTRGCTRRAAASRTWLAAVTDVRTALLRGESPQKVLDLVVERVAMLADAGATFLVHGPPGRARAYELRAHRRGRGGPAEGRLGTPGDAWGDGSPRGSPADRRSVDGRGCATGAPRWRAWVRPHGEPANSRNQIRPRRGAGVTAAYRKSAIPRGRTQARPSNWLHAPPRQDVTGRRQQRSSRLHNDQDHD